MPDKMTWEDVVEKLAAYIDSLGERIAAIPYAECPIDPCVGCPAINICSECKSSIMAWAKEQVEE